MKGYIFLVVNLAVSLSLSLNPNGADEPQIVGKLYYLLFVTIFQKSISSFLIPVISQGSISCFFVEIGEDKDITDVNKDSYDDILEPPNTQRSAISDDDRLWTSPIPYVLEKDLEMNAKGVILRAFDQFRLKSCIDFKPRESDKYYISVQKLGGCFSYVGRVFSGGQDLSIGTYCDVISIVEHEFLHALGFFHEQSRYDRDDHVTIAFENIQGGRENNFRKVSKKDSTTGGVPYDYWSVMHYGKNAFSYGNGFTIITKDPKFQDVIGQRLEVSPTDIQELNLRYKCNSAIAFKMFCGFSKGNMCHMTCCSQNGSGWEMVTRAYGGPSSDHTSLPSGIGGHGQDGGYFMHASTASGKEGDSAWLETHRTNSNRHCHVQCLQFYYYHSGNESDKLNIWIREFQDDRDFKGTRRLVGQITGPPTSHWQLQHVSLNATKHFQVEFEASKGEGSSSGGFSIDDINLSEIECPHVTMQIDDFERVLNTGKYGQTIYSPRQYSRGGYSYRVGVRLYQTVVAVFVQLLSGKYDDQLEWPCPQRQVTFQLLDQTPNIQLHMSKQRSFTSDPNLVGSDGNYIWDNPCKIGTTFLDEKNETGCAGPLLGKLHFTTLTEMKSRDFLKGGSAIFVFSFQDLTPLVEGSALPCPEVAPVMIAHPPKDLDNGPCSSWILTTTHPPPQTTDDNRILTTTHPPPQTTDDNSIFGFSPAMMASPVLILLLALMLVIP
ncbi:meprin A subunit beta-like isoform X5 [Trachinotus anak]|uniref:meprin A subunit beta-like isoform X4 n=1 Tax=Trachinotus anak TaxID=443729 RepID=UPI0039F1D188